MPFDPSQELNYEGFNFQFDTPGRRASRALQSMSGVDALGADPYSARDFGDEFYRGLGYTGPTWNYGAGGEANTGAATMSPELDEWLRQKGIVYGLGGKGADRAAGYFGPDGKPIGGLRFGTEKGDFLKAMAPVAMFAGGAALAGQFGGGGAAAGVEAGAASGGSGAAAGAANGMWDILPAAGGSGAGTTMSGLAGGFGDVLKTLGGATNLMQLISGIYGLSKSHDLAKLPSLDEFNASPMFKAGEQAVTRSMMAQGYQGSGNMMHALATNAQDAYARYASLLRGQQSGGLANEMSALGLITGAMGRLPGWGNSGGGSATPAPATPPIYGG